MFPDKLEHVIEELEALQRSRVLAGQGGAVGAPLLVVAGLRDVLWYIAVEPVIAAELELDKAIVLTLLVAIVEVVVDGEDAKEVDALIPTADNEEDNAAEELIIGEEFTNREELIVGEELVMGERLPIIEDIIIAEELDTARELIIEEDMGNTAPLDDADEAAEIALDDIMADDTVLVLARLDVAAVDEMVELVARRVDEVCAFEELVGKLATRIPATKFWPPEVNEAATGLKKHIPPTE